MAKKKQQPFKVFIRREPGYDLHLTVRFEVADGHAILSLQKGGQGKQETSPALVHEERDIGAKELRAGRFIHVLSTTGRRQSYALSRLTEETLERVPDDGWTELNALTEYGFRYLVVPESALLPAQSTGAAAAQVAVPGGITRSAEPAVARVAASPAAARAGGGTPAPPAARAGTATPTPAPAFQAAAPGGAPSALQRAMNAIRSGRPGVEGEGTGGLDTVRTATPRPAPTAKVSGGMVGRPTPVASVPLADPSDMSHDEAVRHVTALQERVQDLERRLADSEARERDLIEVLTRWQSRQSS